MKQRIPLGIDIYRKLRENDFYYVDKTALVRNLTEGGHKVNVYIRPRSFGKTLNLTMLKEFFDIKGNQLLFEGTDIIRYNGICDKYQCKFPVLYISFHAIDGIKFSDAQAQLMEQIRMMALDLSYLEKSEKLSKSEKHEYKDILEVRFNANEQANAILLYSLRTLSKLLFIHFGKPVIVMIDAFDRPLEKAFRNSYYEEMKNLMHSLFFNTMHTNEYFKFAVLMGELPFSLDRLFKEIENCKINRISDFNQTEYFGFNDADVKRLLNYYNLSNKYNLLMQWHGGYWFGKSMVYLPWSVVNFVYDVPFNSNLLLANYIGLNSGCSFFVKHFLAKSDTSLRNDLNALIAGKSIIKQIIPNLNYPDIEASVDNIWSVLYYYGYLTSKGMNSEGKYVLSIPNEEIRKLFLDHIIEWCKSKSES